MPNLNPTTRHLTHFLLLLSSLWTKGQTRWHQGFGITTATLNFQQNGSGGFAIPLRYDLFQSTNASLSLGTNLKIGTEDKYGLGFPLVLGILLAGDGTGGDIFNNDTAKGTKVCLFSEIPVLLTYNWGLGSSSRTNKHVGFYLGGGMSYTITGFTNNAGHEHSTSFYGWVANIGMRFAKDKDIGFSITRPLENPIGPIGNPLFYQLTFTGFVK